MTGANGVIKENTFFSNIWIDKQHSLCAAKMCTMCQCVCYVAFFVVLWYAMHCFAVPFPDSIVVNIIPLNKLDDIKRLVKTIEPNELYERNRFPLHFAYCCFAWKATTSLMAHYGNASDGNASKWNLLLIIKWEWIQTSTDRQQRERTYQIILLWFCTVSHQCSR